MLAAAGLTFFAGPFARHAMAAGNGMASGQNKNGKIILGTLDTGVSASSDMVIEKNMKLTQDMEARDLDLEGGTLDLDGHILKVTGSVHQTGGTMRINKGTLDVGGDYIIAEEKKNVLTGVLEYQPTNAWLVMGEMADVVKVDGDFCIYTSSSGSTTFNRFLAGTLYVGGDFTQGGMPHCFNASGSHTVVLTGAGEQRITLAGTASQFQNLSAAAAQKKIRFDGIFRCSNLESSMTVESGTVEINLLNLNGQELNITGNAEMTGNVNLMGGKLAISGNLHQSKGTMKINKGTLDVGGDYIIAEKKENVITGAMEYQPVDAWLVMGDMADIVKVGRDFCIYTGSSGSTTFNRFSNGTMAVGGDFTQGGMSKCFTADRDHKVILNGKEHQNVTFNDSSSKFNILQLTKNKDTGYTFSPDPCWKTLQPAEGETEPGEEKPHEHTVAVDKAVNPTCTEDGLTEGKHCSECGEILEEQKVVKALGHDYVDGVCTRCGALEIKKIQKGQKLGDQKTGAVYKVTSVKAKSETVEYTKPLNSKAVSISIPATVKLNGVSFKVTSIAANAFKNNKKLAKVTIGGNVTTIGASAFQNCTALKAVTIPAKVKTIGKQAFYGCQKLTAVTIKTKGLTSKKVGSKAFGKLNQKTVVKVPVSCLKTYKKLLQQKGLNGKKQKVTK